MRFLLDTHVFLWLLGEPDRVGEPATKLLADRDNQLHVSAVSAMEVATKIRLGRLTAPGLVETWQATIEATSANSLALSAEHALLAGSMSWGHQDPFDRMLAAQAIVENLTLVTTDRDLLALPGLKVLTWT